MAECRKRVGKGVITYPCIVEIPSGESEHDGPCAAHEQPATIATRRRWESGADARETMATVQSQPMTFAERNHIASPSPVPGSDLQPQAYREVHRPKVGDFGEQPVPNQCVHPLSALQFQDDGAAVCQQCWVRVPIATPAVSQGGSTLHEFVAEHTRDALIARHTLGAHQVMAEPSCPMCNGLMAHVINPPQQTESPTPDVGFMPGEHQPPHYPSDPEFSPDPQIVVDRDQMTGDPTGFHREPTKQRPGDQVLPSQGNPRTPVQDIIIEAMEESKRVGTERYGQPLKPMNGRDTLLDAKEEARDLYVYLTALDMERTEIQARFERAYGAIFGALSDEVRADLDAVLAWLRGEPQT